MARAVEAEAARQRENASAYIRQAVAHRLRVDGVHLRGSDDEA